MKTLFYKALITLVLVISAITWQENMMDASGFEKMGKPKPGEWLFHFHEIGQSFEDYIGAHPVRATAEAVAQGQLPEFVGGGLLRSSGGWLALKSYRRRGVRIKGDEPFLKIDFRLQEKVYHFSG